MDQRTAELVSRIEVVCMITCSRCKYEGVDWQPNDIEAARSFMQRGWTFEDPRVFCPACNGGTNY